MTLSAWELGYAAGLIDGEGCIMINKTGRYKGRRYWGLQLAVSNKDVRALRWLQDRFGGRINRPRKCGVFVWWACANDAEPCLMAVRPFLIIKRDQADLGIAFQIQRRARQGSATRRNTRHASGSLDMEAEMAREMSRMKGRGAPLYPNLLDTSD